MKRPHIITAVSYCLVLTLLAVSAGAFAPTVFSAAAPDTESTAEVAITEVMYNPTFIENDFGLSASDDVTEYVEIANLTDHDVSLKDWTVTYRKSGWDSKIVGTMPLYQNLGTDEGYILRPGGVAVAMVFTAMDTQVGLAYESAEDFSATYDFFRGISICSEALEKENFYILPRCESGSDTNKSGCFNLDNSSTGVVITFLDASGSVKAEVMYDASKWNRNDLALNCRYTGAVGDHPFASVPYNVSKAGTPGRLFENQIPSGDKLTPDPDEELLPIHLMEYNINAALSPSLHANGNAIYEDERAYELYKVVDRNDPDILVLCEANSPQWMKYIEEYFTGEGNPYDVYGYSAYGYCFGDKKQSNEYWDLYTLVLWKKEKYDVIDKGHFWCSSTPEKPNTGTFDDGSISDIPRCINWVILKDKATGIRFVVFGVHLDAKYQESRVNSVPLVLEYAEKILKGLPVIMTGDWNFHDTNVVYPLMVSGPFADARYRTPSPERMQLQGTFNSWGARTNEYNYYPIDHCFLTRDSFYVDKVALDLGIFGEEGERLTVSDHNATLYDLLLKYPDFSGAGVTATLTAQSDTYPESGEVPLALTVSCDSSVRVTPTLTLPDGYATDESIAQTIIQSGASQTFTLTAKSQSEPSAQTPSGDVDGNGKINAKDAAILLKHLAGWSVSGDIDCADLNGDGKVNAKDVAKLLQYIAGWNVELPAVPSDYSGNEASASAKAGLYDNPLTVTLTLSVGCVPTDFTVTVEWESVTTRLDLENAVAETAWAYYHKHGQFQYDDATLNKSFSRKYGGATRMTSFSVPEDGTSDTDAFTVCTGYVFDLYHEALGYDLLDAGDFAMITTSYLWATANKYAPETVLARWAKDITNGGDSIIADRDIRRSEYGILEEELYDMADIRDIMGKNGENLHPGDVVVSNGHAMMYVGNGYILHCWGSKYDMTAETDNYEEKGSIALETVKDYWLTEGTTSYSAFDSNPGPYFMLMRPINALVTDDGDEDLSNDLINEKGKYPTAQAKSRITYPGLSIDRTLGCTLYGSASEGENVTVKLVLKNNSDEEKYVKAKAGKTADYAGLPVTERIPDGCTIVENSITGGGIFSDGVIRWSVDIPAGGEMTLSYSVKIDAPRGSTVTFGGGKVADIPSNSLTVSVGGAKLSDAAQKKFADFAESDTASWDITASDPIEKAKEIYSAVLGIDLTIPSSVDLAAGLIKSQRITNPILSREGDTQTKEAAVLVPLTAEKIPTEAKPAYEMLPHGFIGGRRMYYGYRVNGIGVNMLELRLSYFETGDIFFKAKTKASGEITSADVMICAGDGVFISFSDGESPEVLTGEKAEAELMTALAYDVFFNLRPTLAYDNING